jgi:site-specific recombinase XerD
MAANGPSSHTRTSYLRDLRTLSRWLGQDRAHGAITPDHLDRFLISDMVLYTPTGQPRAAISVNATKSGRRLGARQIQLNFARWLVQAGITRPFSIHSLRHTFATRLYRRTGDLYLVQRALGHRQITTTEVYAKVSDDALRTALGAV